MDPGAIYRYQCDAAFPLSDHADHPDLLRFVEAVQPRRVLTLHGFATEFALTLRERGIEAWAIGEDNQLELAISAPGKLSAPAGASKPTPAGPGSPGDPDDWFDEIVARKGVESNVVMLALTSIASPDACNSFPAERIQDFTQKFTYGQIGDVCADDFAPFFDTSLEVIHDACVNFTPEG